MNEPVQPPSQYPPIPIQPTSKILINAGPSEFGAHRLEAMAICPRFYAYRHVLNLPLGSSTALTRGSLVHVGLAHHYQRVISLREGTDPSPWYDPFEAIDEAAKKLEGGLDLAQLSKTLVTAYQKHYMGDSILPLLAECLWIGKAGTYPYTARLDLVALDKRSRYLIIDHKVVSRIGEASETRYTLSLPSLGHQFIGHTLWGSQFAGVQISLIEASPTEPRFRRIDIDPAPHALSMFARQVEHLEQQILRYRSLDPWEYPMALSEKVCMTAYGKCAGWEYCRWGQDYQKSVDK